MGQDCSFAGNKRSHKLWEHQEEMEDFADHSVVTESSAEHTDGAVTEFDEYNDASDEEEKEAEEVKSSRKKRSARKRMKLDESDKML
jgi:hypothetical protein